MIKNKSLQIAALIASLILLYGFILICLTIIGIIRADSEPFYKKIGDFDARFLPLIDPYKAIKPFGGSGDRNGWYIDLIIYEREPKMSIYLQISHVEKVAVDNDVIMAYSPETAALSEQEKEAELKDLHWFVIVPSQ